ncbi:PAS domain-containing protein [Halanaerobium congolense]|uniref:PAS domain S-box-containing protein n=1 Tax=Halanaerobium congolense TaxID=54121 RepID=A0A4R7DYS6_9FIRM|nr:PAS domain-containing protein [Halanaerobium congolense]TDS25804.1 PAS domain S-box-containing protein [Halanaerobium congolense]
MKNIVLEDSTSIILDQIIQNLSEGVNVTDMNGNIIYANEKSATHANTTIQDMLGNHISNFYPKAVILKVLDSQEIYTNINVEHPDGRQYIVNALPLIIKEQFKGALAIFRDVTEIKIMNNKRFFHKCCEI